VHRSVEDDVDLKFESRDEQIVHRAQKERCDPCVLVNQAYKTRAIAKERLRVQVLRRAHKSAPSGVADDLTTVAPVR
jgi:hypothetical protein